MTPRLKQLLLLLILVISLQNASAQDKPTFEGGPLQQIKLEEGSLTHYVIKCSSPNADSLMFRLDPTSNQTLKSLGLQVLEPSTDDSDPDTHIKVKIISLPLADRRYVGVYHCVARNQIGYNTKLFNVTFLVKNPRTVPTPTTPKSTNVIAGVSITIAVVTLILVWIFYEFFGSGKSGLSKSEIQDFLLGNTQAIRTDAYAHENANYLPYNPTYEVPQDKLYVNKRQILGSGQFGEVFIGRYNSKTVAVKTVKPLADKMYLKSLLAELKIMIYLGAHPFIVGLLGASTSQLAMGKVYIIVECCDLGSLEGFLRKHKNSFLTQMDEFGTLIETNSELDNQISTRNLILWSYQIANAMEYLGSKKVIHGDLASRNVLLSNRETAKITDFGLSRQLYGYTPNYVKQNMEPLPWRWMAYESLRELTFSNNSDMWSYGITIWELFTLGDIPFVGLFWTNEFVESLCNGYRLEKPKLMTHGIYCEVVKCWNLEPDKRPKFGVIAEYFKSLFEMFYLESQVMVEIEN